MLIGDLLNDSLRLPLLESASSVIHAVSGTIRLQHEKSRMAVGDHKHVRLAHEP
jgi:hypothetical protein